MIGKMQLDQCGKSGLKESIYEHFRILDRTFRCDGFHRYLLSCCCRISCVEIQTMNLIFGLEGVIRHNNKPLVNVIEFMMWLKRSKHHTHAGDNNVVAMLFEEWKESIKC